MILNNVDYVLQAIDEFIAMAPASSDRARYLYSIGGNIKNMRKNYPCISIRLSISEIGDLMNAEIYPELSN